MSKDKNKEPEIQFARKVQRQEIGNYEKAFCDAIDATASTFKAMKKMKLPKIPRIKF